MKDYIEEYMGRPQEDFPTIGEYIGALEAGSEVLRYIIYQLDRELDKRESEGRG